MQTSKLLRSALLTVCMLLCSICHADYLSELKTAALQKHLAEHPYWWQLLHYQKHLTGIRSQAVTPAFFLSPEGKTDPGAELGATLESFFRDAQAHPDQSTQCLFIARFEWLKTQLDFNSSLMPTYPCKEFHAWVEGINASRATLIFASDYLNNPSSMFGHTLLRLDTPNQDERTRILSYTLNFAAQTQETNGFLFAVNGLTGGYPGMYSLLPYYEKVKEYNDLESRDLWEYPLSMTPVEIELMLRHIWEIRQVAFPYYFFSANCSWQLLTLLEIGRPTLRLSGQFPVYAIPADTIRTVNKEPGLVTDSVYRAAAGTRLNYRIHSNSRNQNTLALKLANNPLHAIPENTPIPDQARSLETAYDYLFFRYNSGKLPKERIPQMRELLARRAKTEAPSTFGDPPRPATDPAHAHETTLLEIGMARHNEEDSISLGYRPAYHDLMDPPGGYRRGSMIDFLHVNADYKKDDGIRLNRLTIVGIESLAPFNSFFPSTSWFLDTAITRMPVHQATWSNTHTSLASMIRGGAGITVPLDTNDRWLCYGFAETRIIAGRQTNTPGNAGIGPRLGCSINSGQLVIKTDTNLIKWSGSLTTSQETELTAGLPLNHNLNIQIGWTSLETQDGSHRAWRLGLRSYF